MILKKIVLAIVCVSALSSCANYSINQEKKGKAKQYYSSSGFALIYEESLYIKKVVSKKINNDDIRVMHNLLKPNTSIKIINPINSKVIKTKIYKKADYPKIFTVVVSKEIATILDLDLDNPFVELVEVKKNKTFVAKKSNIFEEEKNVAEKAPVDEIKMNDLSNNNKNDVKKRVFKTNNFIIVINDFYYKNSAILLKNELFKKTKFNNISVKKIGNNKYRLLAGPFKNFNALKTTYISLNNLGFEDLNIYKD